VESSAEQPAAVPDHSRSGVTTLLDLFGLTAVPAGVGLLWGQGAAVLAAGVAALILSWRLST
jgi:hypothetical protein